MLSSLDLLSLSILFPLLLGADQCLSSFTEKTTWKELK
jgi:hypothetical protein